MADLLIDTTRLADRTLRGRLPTGVDRVDLAYVDHYATRARALVRFGGRWLVLGEGASRWVFDALRHPTPRSRRRLRLAVASAYARPWPTGRQPILLNISHSGLDQPDYAARLAAGRWRPLFFLHDLIPITHPEYCRPGEADKHRRRLETMLSCGRGLVVNSIATLRRLQSYAAAQRQAVPPTVVAPLAPATLPPPAPLAPLAGPYFIVLGTIEPRKNHLLLLQVWRRLVETLGSAAPRLVIIGQRGWECEQVIDLLERCPALREGVIECPACSDLALSTYFHHARALLFPSFEEGYGLPLVEALMAGVPVLASGLPVFSEIAGTIPDYLDPLDGPGWYRRVVEYMAPDSAARAVQLGRLAGFQAATWDEHFRRVDPMLGRL
jgi:glycosyltransferase involved in cell wall biosynthesis